MQLLIDYPLGIIGTVPMAYEENLAYESLNVTYEFQAELFFSLRLFWDNWPAYCLRYP